MAVRIFYSYSHRDEHYRERLETHLSILKRNNVIETWHDRRISPGNDWEEEINQNLDLADIILLLVSSNFLASDYCYDTETIRALERHDSKEAKVIPIILEPCLWGLTNFAKIEVLPDKTRAVSQYHNQEEAWLRIATAIYNESSSINTNVVERFVVEPQLKKTIGTSEYSYSPEELVIKFLRDYSSWYFSPLRIVKWGGMQKDHGRLGSYSAREVGQVLKELEKKNIVVRKSSQLGNPIYKLVSCQQIIVGYSLFNFILAS